MRGEGGITLREGEDRKQMEDDDSKLFLTIFVRKRIDDASAEQGAVVGSRARGLPAIHATSASILGSWRVGLHRNPIARFLSAIFCIFCIFDPRLQLSLLPLPTRRHPKAILACLYTHSCLARDLAPFSPSRRATPKPVSTLYSNEVVGT